MNTIAASPGLFFTVAAPTVEPSPLRNDVAGFVGRTERGPIGEAVRVEGWRAYAEIFGGFRVAPGTPPSATPLAVRGYFENGGEVAYVIRVADATTAKTAALATQWKPQVDLGITSTLPDLARFLASSYAVRASSPGDWANGTRISVLYRAQDIGNRPKLDISVQAPNEAPEYFSGLPVDTFAESVSLASALIQIIPNDQVPEAITARPGPRSLRRNFEFIGGTDGNPVQLADYLDAVVKLGDRPELALVSLPDVHRDLPADDAVQVLNALASQAEQLHDRMILVDLPPDHSDASAVLQWLDASFRSAAGSIDGINCLAVYHPYLWVADPIGTIAAPLRSIPPSGHVAGLISRLDRERGSHYTPANASLLEAVDLERGFTANEQVTLYDCDVNLMRCSPGRGLQVWGGRALSAEPASSDAPPVYIAHRRLIHRLVRAIRRVAEPLVFDTNGPELWLMLVRAITTVLLEAFAAGGLKGNRPDEAFQVICNESNNPPEARDQGRVLCEIRLAPAVPMEFIVLRVALSQTGALEVFEP